VFYFEEGPRDTPRLTAKTWLKMKPLVRFIFVKCIIYDSCRSSLRQMGGKNMKKELAGALLITIIGGIFFVVTSEAKGPFINEGSNRCCDVAQNCTAGNGVCDCPADRIVDPNGLGYCYSCDRTNCITDA